jgi:hypothetical protein
LASYLPGTSKIHAIDSTLHTKEAILCKLKENLAMDQNRMNQQAEQHRSKHSYEEGYIFVFTFNPIYKPPQN